jgi:very-short-patch-repair endonuclease
VQAAARRCRHAPTRSEALLWQELRGGQLGAKFRRQHPIGPLIVDFCCPRLRLVIEVDGPVHDQQTDRDGARQHLLEARGYHVLRLTAHEVETNISAAVQRVALAIHQLS